MAASTSFPEEESMFEPCAVCGKPGHGSHYGAWTCEPCKCFFAKCVSKGTKSLTCLGNLDCDFSNKKTRAICGFCRFQKCVKAGMTKNKTTQYHYYGQAQRTLTQKSQSLELMVVDNVPRELQEVIDIVDSYEEGWCFTTEKVRRLKLKEFRMANSQSVELARVKAWKDYSTEYEADIRALLPFIDQLQDFFNSHDKAILLKRSAFQLYFLRRVRALTSFGLILSDGRVVKMVDLQFLYGIPLAQEMLQTVKRILRLGCTDEDIAMFTTMVYYKPGKLEDIAHLNLHNPENLAPAQQKFKTLFVKHAETQGFDQRVFEEMIKLCPELEKMKVMHQESLEFLKPYRWAFPDDSLFAEIYDIDSKIAPIQNDSNLPSSSSSNNGSH